MSTSSDRLSDRLGDLASSAVPASGAPPADLWRRGRRRARRRTALAVAGAVAAAMALGGVVGMARLPSMEPAAPTGRVELPSRIFEPSGWLPTATGPTGPLVAVVPAEDRSWTGGSPGLVGVSAVDQSYRFLDLPGWVGTGTFDPTWSLSPDGRYLAYWYGARPTLAGTVRADGVAVTDLATGATRRQALPSDLGAAPSALTWGGDTLWFTERVYTEITDSSAGSVLRASWAWPRADEAPSQVEDPRSLVDGARGPAGAGGFVSTAGTDRWYVVTTPADLQDVPALRLGSGGVVLPAAVSPDRSRLALTVDPGSGDDTTVSVAPVTRTTSSAEPLAGLGRFPEVVAWLDDDQVAVQTTVGGDRELLAVDATTGASTVLVDLPQVDSGMQWATALLSAPVVRAEAPPSPTDPRLEAAGVALLALLAVALAAVRRRRARY